MIERFNLTDDIAGKLKQAMQGQNDYFKQAISSRICQLWEFLPGTFVITRLEINSDDEQVLVVCCFEGQKVCLFTAKLIEFCISNDIEFIRFHTKSKKLGRVMKHKFIFTKIDDSDKEAVYLLRV